MFFFQFFDFPFEYKILTRHPTNKFCRITDYNKQKLVIRTARPDATGRFRDIPVLSERANFIHLYCSRRLACSLDDSSGTM